MARFARWPKRLIVPIMFLKRVHKLNPTRRQGCAACGARVQKPLSQRTHSCACGWSVHRDLNAACNGYRRAWNRQAPLVAAFKIGGGVVPGGLNLPVGESGLGNI
jgi:transposase